MYEYKPTGVCSSRYLIDIKEGVINDIHIESGCAGNLGGIASLLKGMNVKEAISRMEGIQCRNGTSCPDQIAKALKQWQTTQTD